MNETTSNVLGSISGAKGYKINIHIKEVENGFVVHFDRNGYLGGETIYIANTRADIVEIVKKIVEKQHDHIRKV